jgi:hypothetical protein
MLETTSGREKKAIPIPNHEWTQMHTNKRFIRTLSAAGQRFSLVRWVCGEANLGSEATAHKLPTRTNPAVLFVSIRG